MQVAGEPVGEIVKLATDLGGGAAETEKVGELQPDDPKTNRRASRATYVFRQSPLSRAPRPFVGPVLKGRNGADSDLWLNGRKAPGSGRTSVARERAESARSVSSLSLLNVRHILGRSATIAQRVGLREDERCAYGWLGAP